MVEFSRCVSIEILPQDPVLFPCQLLVAYFEYEPYFLSEKVGNAKGEGGGGECEGEEGCEGRGGVRGGGGGRGRGERHESKGEENYIQKSALLTSRLPLKRRTRNNSRISSASSVKAFNMKLQEFCGKDDDAQHANSWTSN